jgi:NAD(P)-dependent dehydrogenase (short-subunit alcohol dehydrogenase family)
MATIAQRTFMLVTGGSGGIGSALCRLLPGIGITPIVGFNTNLIQANLIASETGGLPIKIDMGCDESIRGALENLGDLISESDVLLGVVFCASPPPDLLPYINIGPDHLLHQFRINVVGPQTLLSGLIKKFFRKKKLGTVVGILTKAIGSFDSQPAGGMGAYVIAKSALYAMLSVCTVEYNWLKVRTVSPGFTKTQMLNVFDSRYLEIIELQNQISTPEKVAQLIIDEIIS